MQINNKKIRQSFSWINKVIFIKKPETFKLDLELAFGERLNVKTGGKKEI